MDHTQRHRWTTPRDTDGPHTETQLALAIRYRVKKIKNGPHPDTVSIGYKTQSEDNQEWTTHRDTVSIGYKTQSEDNQEWTTPRDTVSIGYNTQNEDKYN
jgi:hypothetical protein